MRATLTDRSGRPGYRERFAPTALRVVGGDGAAAFDLLLPTHRAHQVTERLAAHRTHG